jgi:ATPase complex subunit ATP10
MGIIFNPIDHAWPWRNVSLSWPSKMNRLYLLGNGSIHRCVRSWHRQLEVQSLASFQQNSAPPSRSFSGKTPDYTKLQRFEDANPERIRGIQMNPDGIGSKILPGNMVYKKYKFSGNTRKVPLELVHGYFWMMWDLRKTNNKPTLSNETLIPEEDSQLFPVLTGVKTLNGEKADLPFYFVDNDKVKTQKITLVAISFRDSGFKHIPTWTDPFLKAFQNDSRIGVAKVSITERWSLYPLTGALSRIMKNNTPPEEHDNTLLYFGTDVDDFRDILRMHNIMTNHVFLVDDLGRIRFAGSGPATEDDVAKVVGFAKELASEGKKTKRSSKRSPSRVSG